MLLAYRAVLIRQQPSTAEAHQSGPLGLSLLCACRAAAEAAAEEAAATSLREQSRLQDQVQELTCQLQAAR